VFRDTDITGGNAIAIHGAREHNLKNLSLRIPRDQFVVITGVSGSGKSTLAFDLLFAEGQRRFLDSMSVYARQFVEQMSRPDVDLITGIPPTVSIEQRTSRGGGKSTVATVTEVYHFIRLARSSVRIAIWLSRRKRETNLPVIFEPSSSNAAICFYSHPSCGIERAFTRTLPSGPRGTASRKSGPMAGFTTRTVRFVSTGFASTT
jgi:hypothetical protein